MVTVSLWNHQRDHVDATRKGLVRARRCIKCAPPGAGKTRMSKYIIAEKLKLEPTERQTGRVLFCVHRRGLVDNACKSLNELPRLEHGVIMSGRKTEFHHKLQVGSIDSLVSWWCKPDEYKGYTFDLIIYDECHAHCSKLMTFLRHHDRARKAEGKTPAFVLGLSATPQGDGLADTFQTIVQGPSPQWLIDNGYLKPFRYFEATQGQLDLLVKSRSANGFTEKSQEAAFGALSGDLVRDWRKYGEGRATVGFFGSQVNAQEAKELLVSAGVKAEYVDCNTSDDSRRIFFKMLDQGEIDYIANVGIIERGTDIPRVSCVQLCLAIGNLVRYRQMIGRGSRPHPDCTDCMVIDHADNVKNHGLFEDEIDWCLDHTIKVASDANIKPTIKCPRCGQRYRGGRCKACGYTPSMQERRGQGLVFDGQELQEYQPRIKQNTSDRPYSDERTMVTALYKAMHTNKTWKQAIMIAKADAAKVGKQFKVPQSFEVAGDRINSIPFGDLRGSRKVSALFPELRRKAQ